MADVSLLDGARADFDAALDWYAPRSESAALHFAAAVADAVQRVSREPGRFALIDGIHRQARVKRFPYRLIFLVDGNMIAVVAVAHHSRRPGYWRHRNGS
jgi:toxin ParE1/3/4